MRSKAVLYVGFVVVAIGLLLNGLWFFACAKAAAFNRATGSHVTPWDALFVDLRIQAPPK